jgi:amino acid transporter
MAASARTDEEVRRLGTFGGVFVPNVLTILGVIMFLRAGWVVGNAGLAGALLILLVANSITLLTTLSLSAVATNTRVGVGGAYFLVARSLGLELGGSIGVPLYLAQAVSVAFYLVGFSESLLLLFPETDARLASSVGLGVFFVIAWFGAGWAVKTQYVILAVLAMSLVSFFSGYTPISDFSANLPAAYLPAHSFWTVFAIFFPAVTGIMAGVSMSGDLRAPAKSIPRGTLAAVILTFVIYAAHMAWLALNAERSELIENNSSCSVSPAFRR